MRGSVTINDAYYLTDEDRAMISALIRENLTTAKETGQPFF